MARKKTTEPEGMEQATGMEQSGLTGENVDAAAVPDETASQDGFPAGTPAEGAADAIPEKTPPPPALETEAVGAEPLPPDEEESLWNVPPAKEQLPSRTEAEPATAPAPEKTDRQAFFNLNFNALDRGLTAEERQEWNSIYASYRGRSALTGKIIGVDPLSISVRNRQTGALDRQTMYCAVVVPYRVRIVIPASEMWEDGQERPDFVLQNMVGASIDFIVTKVDRESGFAVASRASGGGPGQVPGTVCRPPSVPGGVLWARHQPHPAGSAVHSDSRPSRRLSSRTALSRVTMPATPR